jgi:DNA-binding MarR family transcriptional regulator
VAATPAVNIRDKLGGAPHSKHSLRLWLRLLSCALVVEKRIRNKLKDDFDTTLPRFDVMAALQRSTEGLTMGELSHSIMVSNGNVTGVVSRLIADKMVERAPSQTDKRIVKVALTRKGREAFSRMAAEHERWIDQTFADLSDKQITDLLARLAEVRRSIDRNTI